MSEVRRLWLGYGLALCAGPLVVLGVSWIERPRLITTNDQIAEWTSGDPALGTAIPLSPKILEKASGDILIVLLGSCSGCSRRDPDQQVIRLNNVPTVVAVSEGDVVQSSQFDVKDFTFVIKNDRVLTKSLNGIWAPRLALVRKDGTLKALQGYRQTAGQFLEAWL